VSRTHISALVPLALLETVRTLDRPPQGDEFAYPDDHSKRRLGASATVASQIARYRELARLGVEVEVGEVVQLLRLVGRRGDAGLAFSESGRWAAREALRRSPFMMRLGRRAFPLRLRYRLGFRAARKLAARVFGVTVSGAEGGVVAVGRPPSAEATPGGEACGFYGAALAELLRSLTQFDGAMLQELCRARGEEECRWHSNTEQAR